MARLLIVSRSMALAMRLADQHDVIEHPVAQLDDLRSGLDTDVLVLDLGDPVLAVNTVNGLREIEEDTPVLLVSGYQPEWEQVEAQRVEGVHVVPLPITRVALLHGISVLTDTVGTAASDPTVDVRPVADPDQAPIAVAVAAAPATPVAVRPATPVADSPRTPVAAAPATPISGPAPVAVPNPVAVQAPAWLPVHPPDWPPSAPFDPAWPAAGAPGSAPGGPDVPTDDAYSEYADGAPYSEASEYAEGSEYTEAPQYAEAAEYADGSEYSDVPQYTDEARYAEGPGYADVPEYADDVQYADVPGYPGGAEYVDAGAVAPEPERPEVTSSDVAGLSYSTSITRPFEQEPPTGQLPIEFPVRAAVTGAQRWLHTPSTGVPRHGNQNGSSKRISRLGPRPRKQPKNPPASSFPAEVFPASSLEQRLDHEAATLAGSRPVPGGNGISLRTADLVGLLHERAGDLYGVSDTAQVLADDVIERADADAAAVLVPDGPLWRVNGGVGLRPLERRLVLEDSHWLITEIGSAGRAVLIEDTDIIRQQLSGAPLAAWRHLLALPVPDVRAIVVLARGHEGGAFTDADLAAVIAPIREAAGLLAQALQTRRLARALGPLREVEGETPIRPSPEL